MTNDQSTNVDAVAAELDERALETVTAAGTTHTGGRFMLDVSGHNVGLVTQQPQGGQGQGGGSKGIIAVLIGL